MTASCISLSSSATTVGNGGIFWIAIVGVLIHIWSPEISDGCDISYLLIWHEISSSFHKGKPGERLCHWFTVLGFMGMGLV